MGNSYQIDHLQFMQAQEESYYHISADYLSSSSVTITADDRHALCSWSYEIIELLSNINREISCIGMSYLDRFMATSSARAKAALSSRLEYQLATVACMVIALKNRGGVKLGTNFVAKVMCSDMYTSDELDVMEMEVLQALSWRLNGPSPHEFIDAIVGLLPASSFNGGADYALSLRRLAKYSKLHVEAAFLDYDLAIQLSASNLAYAAILTSLQKTSVVEGFHPMDLIKWMSTIKSVLAGSRADEIFVKGIIAVWYSSLNFSDSHDEKDDDDDDDDVSEEASMTIASKCKVVMAQ